jgi:hypothetical protein
MSVSWYALSRSVVAAMLVCAAVALAPDARAASSQRCARAHGRTLVANAVTRVYRQPGRGTQICALPGGRSLGLGDQDNYPDLASVVHVAVAGKYAAYALYVTNRLGVANSVRVIDAQRRRVVRTLPPDSIDAAEVDSLVVTPTAALAWIVARRDGVKNVWTAAPSLAPKLIATSGGIDAASLALGFGRIFWMQDGAPQTAPI